jgi:formylglycine-generating enzyme required for sulfatase activity
LVLAGLGAALLLPAAGQGDDKGKTGGRRYALIVGVRNYKKDELRPLKYADKDAKALADVLKRADYRRVVLMTYETGADDVDLLPTARNIREQLKSLLEDRKKEDSVVVAFVGHGAQLAGSTEHYLCPIDAELGETKTLVALSDVYKELGKCKAGKKLAILDACYANPQAGINPAKLDKPKPQEIEAPAGVLALFSTSAGHYGYESERLGRGIFMHFLLEGLNGKAALPGGSIVKLDALLKYLVDEVPDRAKDDNGPKARQEPFLLGGGAAELVLIGGELRGGAVAGINSVGMKLVTVPKGKFKMGSLEAETGRDSDEGPQHEVEITQPFQMGAYEVTQEEYQKVMGTNPSYFSAGGGGAARVAGMDTKRFPVENVSWDDAQAFCRKLSELPAEKKAGRSYRLPTEAEWEHACRAGTTTAFHYGASLTSTQANMYGLSPYGGAKAGPNLQRTEKVGSYRPNAFGLYDMHGNVLEWCQDWFDTTYYRTGPRVDPP